MLNKDIFMLKVFFYEHTVVLQYSNYYNYRIISIGGPMGHPVESTYFAYKFLLINILKTLKVYLGSYDVDEN